MISFVALFVAGMVGNTIVLFSHSPELDAFASFLVAIWSGGTVSVASIRALELVGPVSLGKYWARMCLVFAVGLLVASTAFAALLERGVKYIDFYWMVEGLGVIYIVLTLLSYRHVRVSNVEA